MDWGNAYIRNKHISGDAVTGLEIELHLEGDFKKTSKKVHWLAESASAPLVPAVLLDYDYLITKKKIEEEDDWEDFINKTTEYRQDAVADANVKDLKRGDIVQLERKGYYIVDKAWGEPSDLADGVAERVELVSIPDGRVASVSLKAAPPTPAGKKAPAAAAVAGKVTGLPEIASADKPVSATLLSNGTHGYEMPVTTKMYRVEPTSSLPQVASASKMYEVGPIDKA
jgi:glutamyl-tRNA synthetase